MSEHAKLPAGAGAPPTAFSNQWIVRVSDNFNYAEDEGSYTQGSYATYAEALAICKGMVLADLEAAASEQPSLTPDEIYQEYISFGEDPRIVGPDTGVERFSAWTFARQQCDAMRLAGDVTSDHSTQLNAGLKEG